MLVYRAVHISLLVFAVSLSFLLKAEAQVFNDVTSQTGLNFVTIPGTGTNGVAIADINQNGCPDIYFVVKEPFRINDQRTWNRLFRNNCNGTFTDITTVSGLRGADPQSNPSYMGSKFGAAWGDFNNNGYPDIFLSNAGFDHLYLNNGDNTFTNISEEAGIQGKSSQVSTSSVWFDYNNSGFLDLYVSVWESSDSSDPDLRNRLYRNNGDGTFTDVSQESGVADGGRTWVSLPIDVNNNGRMDLYVINDFGPNRFYQNKGDGTFEEQTADFNLEDRFEGMGVAVADLTRNGYFDIFITNNTEKPFNEEQINALFLADETGTYQNISKEAGVDLSGWGWGTEFIDFNNNGFEDLFITNGYFDQRFPNRLFKNRGETESVQFDDVSTESGLADSTEARAVAVFDYDGNGKLDLVISNFQKGPFLVENHSDSGNWLSIKLEGTISNRQAVGAVAEVSAGGELYRKYVHGSQFLAQNVLPLHFGLGAADQIDRVKIIWPSGGANELVDIEVNQKINIREQEGVISSITQNPLSVTDRPNRIELTGNYPNPFNGQTVISFKLAEAAQIDISIYTIVGQKIYSSTENFNSAGSHQYRWQMDGAELNSGIYLYTLTDQRGYSVTGRMIYLK